jgi:hypothetical protein
MQQVDPPIQNNAVSFVLFFLNFIFCPQFIVMSDDGEKVLVCVFFFK